MASSTTRTMSIDVPNGHGMFSTSVAAIAELVDPSVASKMRIGHLLG
jgi:hypothetical protein